MRTWLTVFYCFFLFQAVFAYWPFGRKALLFFCCIVMWTLRSILNLVCSCMNIELVFFHSTVTETTCDWFESYSFEFTAIQKNHAVWLARGGISVSARDFNLHNVFKNSFININNGSQFRDLLFHSIALLASCHYKYTDLTADGRK